MIPKYSSRYLFYRAAGQKMKSENEVHAVRNPRKSHKLDEIAKEYQLDPVKFRLICNR